MLRTSRQTHGRGRIPRPLPPKRTESGEAIIFARTADRNFALGYFMREKKVFPPGTNLIQALEFYFQCCSIETNAAAVEVAAASLANAGICPTTGDRVFHSRTVQNCLSLMSSCGLYDFSGEFAPLREVNRIVEAEAAAAREPPPGPQHMVEAVRRVQLWPDQRTGHDGAAGLLNFCRRRTRYDAVNKIELGFPMDMLTKDMPRSPSSGGMRDQIDA